MSHSASSCLREDASKGNEECLVESVEPVSSVMKRAQTGPFEPVRSVMKRALTCPFEPASSVMKRAWSSPRFMVGRNAPRRCMPVLTIRVACPSSH